MLCHQTLQSALGEFSQNYFYVSTYEDFARNELACCIRQCIPTLLKHIIIDCINSEAIENHLYHFKGSPGQGNWATIPWIAIMDGRVTDTVQRGFFVIYSLNRDGSGLYLSINQGVAEIQRNFRNAALDEIVRRREILTNIINIDIPNGFHTGAIEYGAPYNIESILTQNSTVISKLYKSNEIPEDNTLIKDIQDILSVYQNIISFDRELGE